MPTFLYSPHGDRQVALTSGHTFVVPGNPEGVEVPLRFVEEAIRRRGCLPIGTTLAATRISSFDRVAMIANAVRNARANVGTPDAPATQPTAPRAAALDSGLPACPETASGAPPVGQPVTTALDDPVVRKIAAALQAAGDSGLTRTAVRDLLGRNAPAAKITAALELLRMNSMAKSEIVSSGGRPREVWRAKTSTKPCDLGVPPNAPSATTEVPSSTPTPTRKRPKDVRDMNRAELEAYAAELKMHPRCRELSDGRLRQNIVAFLIEMFENAG